MKLVIFLCFLLSLSTQIYSATNTAATVAQSDVQAAINSAADGDTVLIPAGSATWTGIGVTNHLKNLSIIGAGKYSTFITSAVDVNEYVFNIRVKLGGYCYVSKIHIIGGANEYAALSFEPRSVASSQYHLVANPGYFRVTDCVITNLQKRGITYYNSMVGLINSNIIICPVQGTGISPDGTDIFSSNSWNRAWVAGSTNCVVIEANWFDWKTTIANGAIDAYGGSWFMFRYNIVTNGNIGWHGTDSGGSIRSVLGCDANNNTIYLTAAVGNASIFNVRGGAGIWWSNTSTFTANGATPYVFLSEYRATGTNVYQGTVACCNPYGPVSGTNYWDGNSNAFGWPALDQMGRTGPTTYNATNISQAYSPLYAWGNLANGTNANRFVLQADDPNTGPYSYIAQPATFLQGNRDFFDNTSMPGYTAAAFPLDSGGGGGGSPPPVVLTNTTQSVGNIRSSGNVIFQ